MSVWEGICAWCGEIDPLRLSSAVRDLLDQLAADSYCVVCDQDTGEGLEHESWCGVKAVMDALGE